VSEQGGGEVAGREDPHGAAEEGYVEPAALAGAPGVNRGGGAPAGDAHPADEVAEGGTLLHVGLPRRREPVGDAAARPERDAVVAAPPGVRPARPLTVTLGVDESRVDAAEILVREPESLARV